MTPVPPISVTLQFSCQHYIEHKRCFELVDSQTMVKFAKSWLKACQPLSVVKGMDG